MPVSKSCVKCNKEYFVKPSKSATSLYCSNQCKGRGQYIPEVKHPVNCQHCNKEYGVKKYLVGVSKYCSKSCQTKGTLAKLPRTKEWKDNIRKAVSGKKRTQESKDLISKARTGAVQSKETIAKRVAKTTGLKRSDETKKRMSVSARSIDLSKRARGEKIWNWKGGITPVNKQIRTSSAYVNWRRQVYERDDYTCQVCGQRGGELNADHIKSFANHPELRLELSNGRTLCKPCHQETDTYLWKANKFKNKVK